jgi:hypothetical protein
MLEAREGVAVIQSAYRFSSQHIASCFDQLEKCSDYIIFDTRAFIHRAIEWR